MKDAQVQHDTVQEKGQGNEDEDGLGDAAGLAGQLLGCPGEAQDTIGNHPQNKRFQDGHRAAQPFGLEYQRGESKDCHCCEGVQQGGQLESRHEEDEQSDRDNRGQKPGADAKTGRSEVEGNEHLRRNKQKYKDQTHPIVGHHDGRVQDRQGKGDQIQGESGKEQKMPHLQYPHE